MSRLLKLGWWTDNWVSYGLSAKFLTCTVSEKTPVSDIPDKGSLTTTWHQSWTISFRKFSWQLSAFSLSFSSPISALLVLSTIYLFIKVSFSPPQWGAADAEIKVPSGENTELKRSPFKAWSRSVYIHTCYAYCQGFLSFLLISTLPVHSPAFFPKPLPIFPSVRCG